MFAWEIFAAPAEPSPRCSLGPAVLVRVFARLACKVVR